MNNRIFTGNYDECKVGNLNKLFKESIILIGPSGAGYCILEKRDV